MPKEEIYFRLEQEFAKNDIVLNEESRNEGVFSLKLKNVTVYVKGIPLATIEEMCLFTLLFYNSIDIETLMIDESLKTAAPTQIDTLSLSQGVWAPMMLAVEVKGPFGKGSGDIDMRKRILHMNFNDTKGLDMLGAKLKQEEKGWSYETSF